MLHAGRAHARLSPCVGPVIRLLTAFIWLATFHEAVVKVAGAKTPAAKPSGGKSKAAAMAVAATSDANGMTLQGVLYEATNHMPLPKGVAHVGVLPPYGAAMGGGQIYFGDAAKHRVQVAAALWSPRR